MAAGALGRCMHANAEAKRVNWVQDFRKFINRRPAGGWDRTRRDETRGACQAAAFRGRRWAVGFVAWGRTVGTMQIEIQKKPCSKDGGSGRCSAFLNVD